ncbi:MAG: ABC transporter ATP-binding protein [Alphaproteobacteria bacterium]
MTQPPKPDTDTRAPLAVVGSQTSQDEALFGRAFDKWVVRRFLTYLTPYRRRIAIGIAAIVVFTLMQLAIPLVVRSVIDQALAGPDAGLALLQLVCGVFLAVVVLSYVSNHIMEIVVGKVAQELLFDLRRAMYGHLQKVSLTFMDKTETGRLMSRLQGDVGALQEFLESSIFAIGDLLLLIGIIIVTLSLDPVLGALTLSVVPILFIVRIIWLPLARKAFMRARETQSATNAALAETVHGVRTIQELRREDVNFGLFDDKAHDNLKAQLSASKYTNVMVPIVDTLSGAAMAIVIIVGGGLVLEDALDIGVMVAFLFYVQRFFDPIRSLTLQYSVMQRAMAAGQRIFEVLDVEIDVADAPNAEVLGVVDGKVELRNITFGYAKDQPILRNVSFTAAPGETIALVGATGSGKTSIAALIHRFYDVWDGAVLINGRDVRSVTQESLARNVGMVLQDPFLFSGTIFENIRYSTTIASRDDVMEAAKAVGLHALIEAMPDGYETMLEEGGGGLSLGQRQLVSFARALVADTRILILDEATANIDSYTELQIQAALARLLKGRTAIVIAHRLATIRGADRIIVLQDGQVIEAGNHDALMASGGSYSQLYSLNYASFDDA